MLRKRVWFVVLSVVLVLGLVLGATGCAPKQPAAKGPKPEEKPPKTFKIGLIVPLTGVFAAPGTDMRDGLRLFLDEKGGVLAGHPVELIVEDTAGDPATALTKARKLVESDRVDILMGPLLASEAYAVAEFANKNKITLILPIPSADSLTKQHKSDYVLRTGWSSSQPSHPFADYVYNKLGYKKVATIGMDYAFGYEVVGGFQYRFEELGGKVVKKIWTPIGVPDFGPYLAAIPKDVDAVFALYAGGDATRFIPAYKEYGLKDKLPLIGGGTLTDESTMQKMGDETIGIITPLHYSGALQTPENKEYAQKFQARFGRWASYYNEGPYTAGLVLEAVLKAAGDNYKDPLKFAEVFRKVKVVAPRGPVRFDEYNNPIQNIYIRKVEKIGGQLQNTVIETIPEVSQFGPYDPKEFLSRPTYDRDYPPLKK